HDGDGIGMNAASRSRSGGDDVDPLIVIEPRERLGHLTAGGVAGAEKEDASFHDPIVSGRRANGEGRMAVADFANNPRLSPYAFPLSPVSPIMVRIESGVLLAEPDRQRSGRHSAFAGRASRLVVSGLL